jgi:aspartate aminotransferase
MAVSDRIKTMMGQSSWIRRMFEAGARLSREHGAENVCDFSIGNPNLEPPELFQQALHRIVDEPLPGKHGYMPNAGYPAVRAAVATRVSVEQGVHLDERRLLMTCGAGGALNVALKTILNPGDVVLASTPCFMEYRFYTDNHGGMLDLVSTKPDFDLDIGALEARITERTAAVLINSPNNPSGRIYPEATLRELGRMLEAAGKRVGRTIYLVSDEPYRKIAYGNARVPGTMAAYRNTIVGSSYSKDLSVPGERIGWLAVHPDADGAADLFDGFVLCNRILGYVNAPSLMQRVVAEAGDTAVDVGIYQRKRDRLCAALQRIGYEVSPPEGTFYLFPRAPGGDDLAAVEALQAELILTVPGRGFGTPGYFRIAFCVADAVIERSLAGFERALARLARR